MLNLEFLQYQFMQNALLIGVLTAITSAFLGSFMVAAQKSMLSDTLSHLALVGVGLGVVLGISPVVLSVVSTCLLSILLYFKQSKRGQNIDGLNMVVLSGSLALTLVLVSLNPSNPIQLENYLFGSILTINNAEIQTYVWLNLLILILLCVRFKDLVTLVFDPEFLHVKGRYTLNKIIFLFCIGLLIATSLKVVGGLLIGGLLTISVLTAQHSSQSFKQSIIRAIVYNIIGVALGLFASFYLNLPASSAIILVLISFFILSRIKKLLKV